MYEDNKQSVQEIKFNYFLNKTIIGASKQYYRKQQRVALMELQIIDDINSEEKIKKYIKVEDKLYDLDGISGYKERLDNENVIMAYESLTDVEQWVIFLIVEEEHSLKEAAKMLNMYIESISRAKTRALKKLEKYLEMKGFDFYGKYL